MSKKHADGHSICSTNCTGIQRPHGANIIYYNSFQQQQQQSDPSSVLKRNTSGHKIIPTTMMFLKIEVFQKY